MAGGPVVPLKPEMPRRRSTVREPVPFLAGNTAAAPQPAPTIGPDAAEVDVPHGVDAETAAPSPEQPPAAASEPAPPRRAGWWAKRMLGDKH
jgi:ribonuclease E